MATGGQLDWLITLPRREGANPPDLDKVKAILILCLNLIQRLPMPAVFLEEDVHAHILKHAKVYVDKSESDTLRRLLSLEAPAAKPSGASAVDGDGVRLKKRKVDIWELKSAGLLSEGQTLYLHDYKGKRLEGFTAEIGPTNKLLWSGRRYSMSALASLLLQKKGYAADSVRGPAHWYTERGESVLKLWQKRQAAR